MANNFTANIAEGFDLAAFAEEIKEQYQAKGFQVRSIKTKTSIKLVFDKNCGGINNLLGLGQGISATCAMQGKEKDILSVNFTNGDWTGKIVGLATGWFLCLVPFITAIVGIVRQSSLAGEIENDMLAIIGEME